MNENYYYMLIFTFLNSLKICLLYFYCFNKNFKFVQYIASIKIRHTQILYKKIINKKIY